MSCTPLVSPVNGTPLNRMMNAVHVQMINVSVNTPNACISPCLTGWVTSAVAATFGADPMPASLLNNPRLMPCITAIPIPPPIACFHPNAWEIIVSMTCGSNWMFKPMMMTTNTMYPNAMMGTMMLLTLAIRWMPPKKIVSDNTVSIIPMRV